MKTTNMKTNTNWADQIDEPETSGEQKKVVGPDKNGIYTETEITTNEKGEKIKIITRFKSEKVTLRVNKHVEARKKWKPFGIDESEKTIAAISPEEIFVERPRPPGEVVVVEEKKTKQDDGATSEFYKRLQDRIAGREVELHPSSLSAQQKPDGERPTTTTSSSGGENKPAAYVPPNRKNAAMKGSSMPSKDDSFSLRVTNLSEDTTEDDLRELLTRCSVKRIYIGRDRNTHQSRGFAFVDFYTQEDAERALQKLDGCCFNHVVLRVEFQKKDKDGMRK